MSSLGAQSVSETDEERRCLALSMYWEARGEGPEGMRAVGSVVLNRMASPDFPETACGVVYEGGETPPCQFSWWCDGRSDEPREEEPWRMALELAEEMLRSPGEDPTDGALFFHHADLAEPWVIERTRTVQILSHVYYR
jgi:N-acetylmuramoyl-L-alanine amidase